MNRCGSWTQLFLVVAVLVATLGQASASSDESQSAWKMLRQWQRSGSDFETQRSQARKINIDRLQNSIKAEDIPPTDQPALVARFIVNQAEWASVATISSRKDIESAPFASLVDISDGLLGSGSGVPYMFLTPLDSTAQDVARDERATILVSLVQGSYCENKDYDPMDPRCARAILTGAIKKVDPESEEYPVAKAAIFGRHPWLVNMPPNHHFFFAKLEISTIVVLDTFGGPKHVTPEEYLNAKPANHL